MRDARAHDHWRHANSQQYSDYIKLVNLNGHKGINQINFEPGISAICGLNGVGKSTIISAVKDLIGLPMTKEDIIKVGQAKITGEFVIFKKTIKCENTENKRLFDSTTFNNIQFIDYDQANYAMKFFVQEQNIDELLEQNEKQDLEEEDVKEISNLIGCKYSHISIHEIEDISEFNYLGQVMDNNNSLPFFTVDYSGIKYTSINMGIGEHFLMYIYWRLINIKKDSIIILEEPETFIGIESQRKVMNYLAKIADKKKVSILITTHSPFILENIKNENIIIVGRTGMLFGATVPGKDISAFNILGINEEIHGTYLVEDDVANIFLEILLERENIELYKNYSIQIVGSSSEITTVLKSINPKNIKYNFIGIYDQDQEGKINESEVNWKFIFLPIKKDVEATMKEMLQNQSKIEAFADKIKYDKQKLIIFLGAISGEDRHDWFRKLCEKLAIQERKVMNSLYDIWEQDHRAEIKEFSIKLADMCN